MFYEIKLRLTSTRLVGNETTEIVGRASLAYVITNGDIAAFISHRDALFHSLATWHHCPSASRADHGFCLTLCRCCSNGVLAFCQNVRIVFTISDEFDRRTTRAVCCLNLAFFTCNKVITMVCLILTVVYYLYIYKKKNIYPGFLMVVLGGTEIPLLVLQYLDYRR